MSSRARITTLVSIAALATRLVACASPPSDATPAGALQLFLAAMDVGNRDPREMQSAYELLARESRDALRQRSEMASALAGRRFEPWEMIAEGRYRLRFAPRASGGFVEQIEGNRATVLVRGASDDETAEVPLVREGERWRVLLVVPPIDRGTSRPAPATDGTD